MKIFIATLGYLCLSWAVLSQPQSSGVIKTNKAGVLCMAIDPDNQVLLTGSDDNFVYGWDIAGGIMKFSLSGHEAPVTSIAVSKANTNGRRLVASGAKNGNIIIYDLSNRSIYYQSKVNNSSIYDFVFVDDFSMLVACSADGKLTFIDLDAKNTHTLDIDTNKILSVDWLAGEKLVVMSDESGKIKFVDPTSYSIDKIIPDAAEYIRSVTVIENEIIAVNDSKAIRIRNAQGDLQNEIAKAHKDWIQLSTAIGDDEHYATGDHNGMVSLWSLKESTPKFSVKTGGMFTSGICFNSELTQMYTVGYNAGMINIWDIAYLKLEPKREMIAGNTLISKAPAFRGQGIGPQGVDGINLVQPYIAQGDVFHTLDENATIKGFLNIGSGVRDFKITNIKTQNTQRIVVDENKRFSVSVPLAYFYDDFELSLTTSAGKQYTKSVKYYRIFNKTDPAELAKMNRNGRDFALIIATNEYSNMGDLINPIFDANAVANELESNYNFIVEKLYNPPLDEIKLKIKEYSKRMFADEDQLFIFIAGHGEYDSFFKEGYIVATDTKSEDEARSSFLPHSTLRTYVNNVPCKHILLMMDVCFGGTFDQAIAKRGFKANEVDSKKIQLVKRKLQYTTRLYMTSGGKEYVPDGRPGHHSPFARRLLESLRTYGGTNEVLTSRDIFSKLEDLSPEPRFGEFGDNEPGSDFIFVYK